MSNSFFIFIREYTFLSMSHEQVHCTWTYLFFCLSVCAHISKTLLQIWAIIFYPRCGLTMTRASSGMSRFRYGSPIQYCFFSQFLALPVGKGLYILMYCLLFNVYKPISSKHKHEQCHGCRKSVLVCIFLLFLEIQPWLDNRRLICETGDAKLFERII